MAGHSQFKNIMHRKNAQDAKRAKLFTKLLREIITAVRTGQPDPTFNARLRNAINTARTYNMPKDKIENAIKRGTAANEGDNFEEIRYEGYAPGGIALIVEALTDNRNRTASEVRAAFTKFGGTLGETGSVSFMFAHVGYVEYPKEIASEEQMFEAAIESSANSCDSTQFAHEICCDPDNLNEVREKLTTKFGEPQTARLIWQPINLINVDGEQAQTLLKLIDTLEDNDDVQYVYGNYSITDEIMRKFAS